MVKNILKNPEWSDIITSLIFILLGIILIIYPDEILSFISFILRRNVYNKWKLKDYKLFLFG